MGVLKPDTSAQRHVPGEGWTYRRKLVVAPAPEPAKASWGKERSLDSGCPFVHRIAFFNSVYARNRVAFSAIAPTIGAGNP